VPGAFTRLGGEIVKVWRAAVVDAAGPPGTVLSDADAPLVVACGEGALELRMVQRAGGRRVAGPEFARGAQLAQGARFEAPKPAPAGT